MRKSSVVYCKMFMFFGLQTSIAHLLITSVQLGMLDDMLNTLESIINAKENQVHVNNTLRKRWCSNSSTIGSTEPNCHVVVYCTVCCSTV